MLRNSDLTDIIAEIKRLGGPVDKRELIATRMLEMGIDGTPSDMYAWAVLAPVPSPPPSPYNPHPRTLPSVVRSCLLACTLHTRPRPAGRGLVVYVSLLLRVFFCRPSPPIVCVSLAPGFFAV